MTECWGSKEVCVQGWERAGSGTWSVSNWVRALICLCSCSASSLRARQVLANLESYKVCRDGWRKKVEQNRLHPEENMEYQSFLPKDEVPDFVLEDTAEKKVPEKRERRNFRGRLPPIAKTDLDLLAKERTSAGTRIVLPPIGKSWAERGPEKIEREREEVKLPVLQNHQGTPQSDTLSSRLSARSPCLGPGMLGSLQAPAALQQVPRVLCSVLPSIGNSWAQRGPERKERERGELKLPALKGQQRTPQVRPMARWVRKHRAMERESYESPQHELHVPLFPMQEKQQRTVPRWPRRLPPLTSTMLETDQLQAGKVSCKKGSEEIPYQFPKIEKRKTLLPPLDMKSP
ncbi:UNVERIFIED_CONTAM: hypothetical protein H355_002327 [Colinus virginianus]|nr:hypothetical protein H355_002327 [Colinus virginianus]